ncbi:hypothetical protein HDV00_009840 [Rhizophlyctis rosea]|nr:hypothetical protein HDV00_009840 [Rhizophlyctis rosea]
MKNLLPHMHNLTSFTFICYTPLINTREVVSLIPLIPSKKLEKVSFACENWSFEHMRAGLKRTPPLKKVDIAVFEESYSTGVNEVTVKGDAKSLENELGIKEVLVDWEELVDSLGEL